ncbi:MAG: hypothetical protein KA297_29065 [Kofleriaceae bacterium]|nr:hypothetical protein [Kofleriaceae bacterium]MBP6837764.1 hypothetical protein [Kofleriaceae bacterium]
MPPRQPRHRRPGRRGQVTRLAAAAGTLCVLAGPARADQLDGLGQVLAAVELVSPDVHLEVADGTTAWALGWALAIRTRPLRVVGPVHVGLTQQVELQYRFSSGTAWRGAVVERLRFGAAGRHGQWLPLLEVGAIAGQDGIGGLVGAGLGYGGMHEGVLIGVLGRRVMTTEGDRSEVTLDIQIPINIQ